MGQLMWTFFTEEQWEMVNRLSQITSLPMESIIEDIAADRYRLINGEEY